MARYQFVVPLMLLSLSVAFAQQPQSDPQAVSLASQSISVLTGGNTISDATLTGTVSWTGGTTPQTGTITLLASGASESRINLALPGGTRTEIRDASTGVAEGQWIAENGASGLFGPQNCATDAVWFFPALGSLAAGPGVVLAYVGQGSWNGEAVQHIQSYIYQSNSAGSSPNTQQLSVTDFYLDATTFLPVAVTFNAHPDDTASTNLTVEIDFSNYQVLNGIVVPMHIRRYLQGNMLLDITLSGASFNTGLPLSDFTIN